MVIRFIAITFCLYISTQVYAETKVIDDAGFAVELSTPPAKIISLAPHLTEILFSVGVGHKIVGTVRFSDYPSEASSIPVLGDAFAINLEFILSLDPDLILAWYTGGANTTISKLRKLGIPVFIDNAPDLASIGTSFKKIGLLVGQREQGILLEQHFSTRLNFFRESNDGPKKKVFFQISDQQLFTVNDTHLIGQAISTCGGTNIFGSSDVPVPIVSTESVLVANPDIIIISKSSTDAGLSWLEKWGTIHGYREKISFIDAALISRPSMRILKGIERLCQIISLERHD